MMYNYYREPWLLEKFGRMLQEATEREPQVLFERSDFRMTMVGNYAAFKPAVLSPSRVEVPTDDWPFPYLRQRGMPPLYSAALAWVSVFAALLLGGLGRFSRRGGARQGSLALMLAFMLMGTAFLLLETKSIVQFSLLFGTTWLNTSLVFLGVLVSVLVANWLAHWLRGERHVWITAALLVVACLVGYLYPLANLLAVQSTLLRFLAASALTVSPILLANLLFSIALRDQRAAERLFGWNLFGATLGGLVEYTSLAIGYRALALIVAGCYACVVLLLLYASRSAARQPELQFGSTLAQRDASRP
jgi:hypothetical protein